MPPHERSLPVSYLHSVLSNGSMPFRYRSGVRVLLGMAANANVLGLAAASAPPMEFRYAPAYALAALEVPTEWPEEQWLEANAVASEAGDDAEVPGQPQSRSLQRQESAAPEERTMELPVNPLQPENQPSQPARQRFFEPGPSSAQETEAVTEALVPESPAARVVEQTTMTIPGLSSQHSSSSLPGATNHMGSLFSHTLPSQATVQEGTLAPQAIVFPYATAAAVPASLESSSGSVQALSAAMQQDGTASSEEQLLEPPPFVGLSPIPGVAPENALTQQTARSLLQKYLASHRRGDRPVAPTDQRLGMQHNTRSESLRTGSAPTEQPVEPSALSPISEVTPKKKAESAALPLQTSGVTAVQRDSEVPTASGTTHDEAVAIPGPLPDDSATNMAAAKGGVTGRSSFPPRDLHNGRLEHRARILQAYQPQGDQPVAPTDLLGLQRHRTPSADYVTGVLGSTLEMQAVPATSPAMPYAAEQIIQLQREVAALTARVATQQDFQAPPVPFPTPPVPVPRERPAALSTTSHAFWERHYVSRLYRWSRR